MVGGAAAATLVASHLVLGARATASNETLSGRSLLGHDLEPCFDEDFGEKVSCRFFAFAGEGLGNPSVAGASVCVLPQAPAEAFRQPLCLSMQKLAGYLGGRGAGVRGVPLGGSPPGPGDLRARCEAAPYEALDSQFAGTLLMDPAYVLVAGHLCQVCVLEQGLRRVADLQSKCWGLARGSTSTWTSTTRTVSTTSTTSATSTTTTTTTLLPLMMPEPKSLAMGAAAAALVPLVFLACRLSRKATPEEVAVAEVLGPFQGSWEGKGQVHTIVGPDLRWAAGVVTAISPNGDGAGFMTSIPGGPIFEARLSRDASGEVLTWSNGSVWRRQRPGGELDDRQTELVPLLLHDR